MSKERSSQNADDGAIVLPRDSFLGKAEVTEVKVRGRLDSLAHSLQPSPRFTKRCAELLEMLTGFVHHRCSFNITGALLGGSVGKGTSLNDKSDLDVILLIGGLRDMNEFLARHEAIKTELGVELARWKNSRYLRARQTTTMAVTVQLRASVLDDFIDVDVLPTFDNLNHHASLMSIYAEMDRQPTEIERYEYSSSLAALQITFVRRRTEHCPALVDVIRLVKYWRKTHFKQIESRLKLHLPSSYVMELIVIHLWEKAGNPRSFPLDRAFKAVMTSLAHCNEIFVYWTDFYEPNMYRHRANRTSNKPFVLDPSNPFNNVCAFYSVEVWNLMSKVAAASCSSPLLNNVGSCGVHWD